MDDRGWRTARIQAKAVDVDRQPPHAPLEGTSDRVADGRVDLADSGTDVA